jgi:AcrR family transcriptional regulator
MTDSPSRTRPAKRERLITSAAELLHQQGVRNTTLAQIAAAADVPPGNVYYYFKTRDDLVRAVIDARLDEVRTMLGSFDQLPDPRARVQALVRRWAAEPEPAARYGCPIGTLSSELGKCDGDLASKAGMFFRTLLGWAESQFRQMGRSDAPELAINLLAAVEGAILLANALRRPEIITDRVRGLEDWLESL